MGLRVTEYTPQFTSEDVDSGFVGFNVVWARRKVITPDIDVANPTTARHMAKILRAGNAKSSAGVARATSHIRTAVTKATAGGEIFNSRARMNHSLDLEGQICRAE